MPKAVPASSLQASEGMQQAVRAQQDLVDELERKKKARALHLPTDDAKVKGKLRQLGVTLTPGGLLLTRSCSLLSALSLFLTHHQEPICLFAEDAHDRRERLRAIISRMSDAQKARFLETAKDAHDDVLTLSPLFPPTLSTRIHLSSHPTRKTTSSSPRGRRSSSARGWP